MRTKIDLNYVVEILMGIFILFVVVSWLLVYFGRPKGYALARSGNMVMHVHELTPPIDPTISGNIPHNKYRILEDSIKRSRRLKDGVAQASGIFTGIGVINTISCEQNNLGLHKYDKRAGKRGNPILRYYFKLPVWVLKNEEELSTYPVQYFLRNDTAYVRKIFWDETVKTQHAETFKTGYYRDLKVPFRYHTDEKSLLIPISKSTKTIADVVFISIGVAVGLAFIYMVFCFLKFLLDVSKGSPFIEANIVRLRVIAAGLLVYPLFKFMLNLILWLVFQKYITEDIRFNFEYFTDSWKPLVLGIFFFTLYKAFQKGQRLQAEQEFTV